MQNSDTFSIVVIAAPSSERAPIWPIVVLLSAGHTPALVVTDISTEPQAWVPPARGGLYLYDSPFPNRHLAFSPARLVLAFHDPRDVAVQQFHEAHLSSDLQEPANTGVSPSALRDIDHYVLAAELPPSYQHLLMLRDRHATDPERTLVVSTAQLVQDFEGSVRRLAQLMGVEEAGIPWAELQALRPVRALTPGRYRDELQPATIAALDERHEEFLVALRQMEVPQLRHLLANDLLQRQMRSVIVGQEGELFLTGDANDVIGQITGRKPLLKADLFRIAAAHRLRRIFGATVCDFRYEHMLIPNKECSLRSLLPSAIEFESEGLRPVSQYLKSSAARIWRPFYDSELLSPSNGERYFSQTDTHWNHIGAYRYLLAFLGANAPTLALALEGIPLKRSSELQQGDLGSKLEMGPESVEIITPAKPTASMVFTNDITNEGCIRWFRNSSAPTRERIFIIHDSFALWLLEIIPEICSEVFFFHGTIFDYDVIERFAPSLVLCLQVERFFNRIPETGGDLLSFVEGEEKRKGSPRCFANFWADFRSARD